MTTRDPVEFTDTHGRRVGNLVILGNLPTSGGTETPLLVDEITGALAVIETPHHEVHEGEMWHGEHSFASIANGANADIRLRTGADEFHVVAVVTVTGQATLTVYEGANISAGTAITVYNKRRITAGVAPIIMTFTPTVTATGSTSIIPGRLIPGGSTPQTRVGANERRDVEWIFKPNTEYLFRVNNSSGTAIIVTISIEGYQG